MQNPFGGADAITAEYAGRILELSKALEQKYYRNIRRESSIGITSSDP
jgi:hypothetical protein